MWCKIKSNPCSINVQFSDSNCQNELKSTRVQNWQWEQKHDSLLTFDTQSTNMIHEVQKKSFQTLMSLPGLVETLFPARWTRLKSCWGRGYKHWSSALLSLKPIQWWGERERERGGEATKSALFRLETCAAYVSRWARTEQQTFKQREALRSCRPRLGFLLCSSFYVPIICLNVL